MGPTNRMEKEGTQSPLTQAVFPIHRRHLREVDDTLPRCPRAPAEVDVLEKEEEARIERANMLKERSTDKETCPHHPIDITYRPRIQVPLEVSPHAPQEDRAQDRSLDQEIGHARKSAVGITHGTILMEELRRKNANSGILLHGSNHALEACGLQYIVRIDDEEIRPPCVPKSNGIPPGIASIARRLEDVDGGELREPVADNTNGVIARMIINDENFKGIRNRLAKERLHTPHRLLRRAVIENNSRNKGYGHQINKDASASVKVEKSLIRTWRLGPAVSLKGSPTVSPVTAA